MASFTASIPVPEQLAIHDPNVAELWKQWKRSWEIYSEAVGLGAVEEPQRTACLLACIGPEARKVFNTFGLSTADSKKTAPVLQGFDDFCEPQRNIPFERYRFHARTQEAGESFDKFVTELRQLSSTCDFENITKDQILRDKVLFGIRDEKVRGRLLRVADLTLKQALDICRAAEASDAQLKAVGSNSAPVNAVLVKSTSERQGKKPADGPTKSCGNCGTTHEPRVCPAYGKVCYNCGRDNHFGRVCRQPPQRAPNAPSSGQQHKKAHFVANDAPVSCVAAGKPDGRGIATIQVSEDAYIQFHVDTGAECNVLPLHIYRSATGDVSLTDVLPSTSSIILYGGMKKPIIGTVKIPAKYKGFECFLNCRIVAMDDDATHKPHIHGGVVLAVAAPEPAETDGPDPPDPTCSDDILRKYADVFSEDAGCLDGAYHIQVNPAARPVQHAPRRGQAALREQLQAELTRLEAKGIITPVTEPTPWISSVTVVIKKSGKIRMCLDPKDLNSALEREHYPLPTVEDVASRMHGARVFTTLDVRHGFWHIALDDESSYLTTFNTPFGRYRYLRMPFGLSSAPEVFQRRMHQVIEGLHGVEVIADDFVVMGYGSTDDEANIDHDRNLTAFLLRCRERNLKLNAEKLKLRQPEVPFIGHIASKDGLKPDPAKVKAILEMPAPEDRAGVMRFLGFVQYLAKFLPHLSELTAPIRQLNKEGNAFLWSATQDAAMQSIRTAVSQAPVLRFYSLQEEVTIQCDASKDGLGAVLLQNGKPVDMRSRAMTPAKTRYAQIEKELLAIVFACQKFDTYIYGRDVVTVESDHKPLESIFKKDLASSPLRLQRMLMQLQRYNLKVTYKRGKEMFLADALSRAYLPDEQPEPQVRALSSTDHRQPLPVSVPRWNQICHASSNDPLCTQLREVIASGWPDKKSKVPQHLQPFFDERSALTIQGPLIFRGQQVLIPPPLRKEMMSTAHATHIGMEGCVRRMRECMYWPRMAAEVRDYVGKCDTCLSHRFSQQKESILQHEVIDRPWAKIGVDLCDFDGRTLLIGVDYYSNYPEVDSLAPATSRTVITALSKWFSRYGAPEEVVTDNGPQFASREFACFAAEWGFTHTTSSPYYPQSNGKAEKTVGTIKRLFTKCKETNTSEFRALLDWRNTPSEATGVSPAQMLMGRRCKTMLPTTTELLQPRHDTCKEKGTLRKSKSRQRSYYNRTARALPKLQEGAAVRVRTPNSTKWTPAVCGKKLSHRSWIVHVNGVDYRRTRRDILLTQERVTGAEEQQWHNQPSESPQVEPSPDLAEVPPPSSPTPVAAADPPAASPEPPTPDGPQEAATVRRSARLRRPTQRLIAE